VSSIAQTKVIDFEPDNELEPPVSLEAAFTSRPGIVDWLIAFYILAVGMLQATALWYYSTYLAYVIAIAFVLFLRLDRGLRIPEFWLYFSLIVWFYVTALFSAYRNVSAFGAWYVTKVYVFAMFVIVRCSSVAKARLFLKMLITGASVVAVIGVLTGYSAVTGGGERVLGMTREPNAFGYMLLNALLGGMMLLPLVGRFWRMGIYGYFVMAFLAMLGSGSRGSALAAFAAVVAYFALEYARNIRANLKWILPVAVLIVALPIITIKLFPNSPLSQRMLAAFQQGGESSAQARIDMYKQAWNLFLRHPVFGVGFGTYYFYSGRYAYTHTAFMELLACTGLLGFILYYSIVFVLWRRLTRLQRAYRGHPQMRKWLNASRAAIIGILANGAFAVSHYDKMATILIGIIVGTSARVFWGVQDFQRTESLYGQEAQAQPAPGRVLTTSG